MENIPFNKLCIINCKHHEKFKKCIIDNIVNKTGMVFLNLPLYIHIIFKSNKDGLESI